MNGLSTAETQERDAFVRVQAPAKINLRLDVLGRRSDGYHEVATVMLAIGLSDEVRARRRTDGQISLSVDGPHATADVPTDGRNLAWRAALAAIDWGTEHAFVEAGTTVALEVTKRIPSRAGLGGGSSDAAAAFVAVEAALGFEVEFRRRTELLAQLGSDVPFFDSAAASGYAWCFGRGERVRPMPLPRRGMPSIVLVVPDLEAPTERVYRALGLAPGTVVEEQPIEDLLNGPREFVSARFSNGLERAAIDAVPALGDWRDLFDEVAHGCFHLCGSGAGWFAAIWDRDNAEDLLGHAVERAAARGLGVRLARIVEVAGHGAVRVGPATP